MSSHLAHLWRRYTAKPRRGEIWLEHFCVTGFLLAALGLFLVGLGNLPLSDGEAVLAQMASEIYESSSDLKSWIFPTFWGEPTFNCPLLVCNLIALTYTFFGISEYTTRLPGALFSAVSVLLLYKIGREIFIARLPALFSAAIYLTFLPIVRLGRLATFDGGLLCLEILTIWAILRSRRDLRWTSVAGIALGATALSSGIDSLRLLAVILIFLSWDTPRLLSSLYFWNGIVVGVAPALLWYVVQWYSHDATTVVDIWHLLLETIKAIDVNKDLQLFNSVLIWLQYLFPWSIVIFTGLQLVRANLLWSWSKLITVWAGISLLSVLLVTDSRYWYILPLCPALALAGGIKLEQIRSLPSFIDFPRWLSFSFVIMAGAIAVTGLYCKLFARLDLYLAILCIALTITLVAALVSIIRREVQFISLLFWGFYVSLFIFVSSPYWMWERSSFEPLKPLANLIQQTVPETKIVYTSETNNNSALSFYSQHQIIYLNVSQLKQYWTESSSAYLLLNNEAVRKLDLSAKEINAFPTVEDTWVLAVKNTKNK
ncbi:glycosyltransferase family 39 protein [Myxosarcina sp. GI1]|uniref:ArnT family glycosyltransferase n=1 Tax=Myxosarcina sp. GI1 TaxID=1541065 RepID=UPI000568B8B1|nr:glycosyltransferase family 39 protein [Myxosarcina sp. GI1]